MKAKTKRQQTYKKRNSVLWLLKGVAENLRTMENKMFTSQLFTSAEVLAVTKLRNSALDTLAQIEHMEQKRAITTVENNSANQSAPHV